MSSIFQFVTQKILHQTSMYHKRMLTTSLRRFGAFQQFRSMPASVTHSRHSHYVSSRRYLHHRHSNHHRHNHNHSRNRNKAMTAMQRRFFSNNNTVNALLERLRSGELTKSEVQRLIVSQDQSRTSTSRGGGGGGSSGGPISTTSSSLLANNSLSSSVSAANNITPNAITSGGSSIMNLGSKSNPVYMKKQTSFKEFIFSLFPFVFIFWMLGGFDMVRNKKSGGVGGMFGNNYSEWDEDDWEDDDEMEDETEQQGGNRNIINVGGKKKKGNDDSAEESELDRRTKFFRRLGIHVPSNSDKDAKTDNHNHKDGKNSTQQQQQASDSLKKKKKRRKRVRFKDVCGNEEAKMDLSDLVDYLKNPQKYQAMGCKLPKGVLMAGAPGTGKTLLARALAGEAGVPFLATNGASFDEIFVGVGVMRVRKLFERAKERAPCIVFIDEIDAIANTRMQMGTAHSSDSLNALLSEMDGFEQNSGVIVIAATNMPDRLDAALIRPGRFDRKVHLSLPDKKAREEIVRLYMGARGDLSVDVALLVSDVAGFSGAEIESMVNLASIEAVKAGCSKVSMAHLVEAKETISMGRARRSLELPLATKQCTAYHEGGHAIVSLFTKGSKPIYKATILPRGQALGFVASSNADEFMTTKESLLAQLDVCMAGRAAEELFNGATHVTTGASSDFNQATRIATAMVCQYGMSPKVGKVFYKFEEVTNLSPELQNVINAEVRRLLDESFYRSKNILIEHRTDLDLLANELLGKETLSGDDIRLLLDWHASKQIEPRDFILLETEIPSSKDYINPRNAVAAAAIILGDDNGDDNSNENNDNNRKGSSPGNKNKNNNNKNNRRSKRQNIQTLKTKSQQIKDTFAQKGGLLTPETELLNPKSIDIENI